MYCTGPFANVKQLGEKAPGPGGPGATDVGVTENEVLNESAWESPAGAAFNWHNWFTKGGFGTTRRWSCRGDRRTPFTAALAMNLGDEHRNHQRIKD